MNKFRRYFKSLSLLCLSGLVVPSFVTSINEVSTSVKNIRKIQKTGTRLSSLPYADPECNTPLFKRGYEYHQDDIFYIKPIPGREKVVFKCCVARSQEGFVTYELNFWDAPAEENQFFDFDMRDLIVEIRSDTDHGTLWPSKILSILHVDDRAPFYKLDSVGARKRANLRKFYVPEWIDPHFVNKPDICWFNGDFPNLEITWGGSTLSDTIYVGNYNYNFFGGYIKKFTFEGPMDLSYYHEHAKILFKGAIVGSLEVPAATKRIKSDFLRGKVKKLSILYKGTNEAPLVVEDGAFDISRKHQNDLFNNQLEHLIFYGDYVNIKNDSFTWTKDPLLIKSITFASKDLVLNHDTPGIAVNKKIIQPNTKEPAIFLNPSIEQARFERAFNYLKESLTSEDPSKRIVKFLKLDNIVSTYENESVKFDQEHEINLNFNLNVDVKRMNLTVPEIRKLTENTLKNVNQYTTDGNDEEGVPLIGANPNEPQVYNNLWSFVKNTPASTRVDEDGSIWTSLSFKQVNQYNASVKWTLRQHFPHDPANHEWREKAAKTVLNLRFQEYNTLKPHIEVDDQTAVNGVYNLRGLMSSIISISTKNAKKNYTKDDITLFINNEILPADKVDFWLAENKIDNGNYSAKIAIRFKEAFNDFGKATQVAFKINDIATNSQISNAVTYVIHKEPTTIEIVQDSLKWNVQKALEFNFTSDQYLMANEDTVSVVFEGQEIQVGSTHERFNLAIDWAMQKLTLSFKPGKVTAEDIGRKQIGVRLLIPTKPDNHINSRTKEIITSAVDFSIESINIDGIVINESANGLVQLNGLQNSDEVLVNQFKLTFKREGSDHFDILSDEQANFAFTTIIKTGTNYGVNFSVVPLVELKGKLGVLYQVGGSDILKIELPEAKAKEIDLKKHEVTKLTSSLSSSSNEVKKNSTLSFNIVYAVQNDGANNFVRFKKEFLKPKVKEFETDHWSAEWRDLTAEEAEVTIEKGANGIAFANIKFLQTKQFKVKFQYQDTQVAGSALIDDRNSDGTEVVVYEEKTITKITSATEGSTNIYEGGFVKYTLAFEPTSTKINPVNIDKNLIKPKFSMRNGDSWTPFTDVNDHFIITYAKDFSWANVVFKKANEYKIIFNYDAIEDSSKETATSVNVQSETDIKSITSTREGTGDIYGVAKVTLNLAYGNDKAKIDEVKMSPKVKRSAEPGAEFEPIKTTGPDKEAEITYKNNFKTIEIVFTNIVNQDKQIWVRVDYGAHVDKTVAGTEINFKKTPNITSLTSERISNEKIIVNTNAEYKITFARNDNEINVSHLVAKHHTGDGTWKKLLPTEGVVSFIKDEANQDVVHAYIKFVAVGDHYIRFEYERPNYEVVVDLTTAGTKTTVEGLPSVTSFSYDKADASASYIVGTDAKINVAWVKSAGAKIDESNLKVKVQKGGSGEWKDWSTDEHGAISWANEYALLNVNFKTEGTYKVKLVYEGIAVSDPKPEGVEFVFKNVNSIDSIQSILSESTKNIKVGDKAIYDLVISKSPGAIIDETKFILKENDSGNTIEPSVATVNFVKNYTKAEVIFHQKGNYKLRFDYDNIQDSHSVAKTVTVDDADVPHITGINSELVGSNTKHVDQEFEFTLSYTAFGGKEPENSHIKFKKVIKHEGGEDTYEDFTEGDIVLRFGSHEGKSNTKAFVTFKKVFTGEVKFFYDDLKATAKHALVVKPALNPRLESLTSTCESGWKDKNKQGDVLKYKIAFRNLDGFEIDTTKIVLEAKKKENDPDQNYVDLIRSGIVSVQYSKNNPSEVIANVRLNTIGEYWKLRFTYDEVVDSSADLKNLKVDRSDNIDKNEVSSFTTTKQTRDEDMVVGSDIEFNVVFRGKTEDKKPDVDAEKFIIELNTTGDTWIEVSREQIKVKWSADYKSFFISFREANQYKIRFKYVIQTDDVIRDGTASYDLVIKPQQTNFAQTDWLKSSIPLLAIIATLGFSLTFSVVALFKKKKNTKIEKN